MTKAATVKHPLVRGDDALVQDIVLTKVTLLLAQNSSGEEREFEIAAMRDLSKQMWEQRNAFLFDFTLARFAIALLTIIDRQEPYAPFVNAVRNGTPARPRGESLNRTASGPLLDLLRANSSAATGRGQLDSLPGPYESAEATK